MVAGSRSLLILAICALAYGNTYYFTHSPNEIPGTWKTWKYDDVSKVLSEMASGPTSFNYQWSMASGAAVCNGRYYASAVSVPETAGLLIVDLATKTSKIYDWTTTPAINQLNLHNMYCDPSDATGQTLIVVENVIGSSSPSYNLFKLNINDKYVFTNTHIGTFPLSSHMGSTGYDNEFQMSPDLKTVYALWTDDALFDAGVVQTMDTTTGAVDSYTIRWTEKTPYSLLVNTNGSMTIFMYAVNDQTNVITAEKCTLTLSGSDAHLSDCLDATELFIGGTPWTTQLSDGYFYAISENSANLGPQKIYKISSTGTVAETEDFRIIMMNHKVKEGDFGGLAVVPVVSQPKTVSEAITHVLLAIEPTFSLECITDVKNVIATFQTIVGEFNQLKSGDIGEITAIIASVKTLLGQLNQAKSDCF